MGIPVPPLPEEGVKKKAIRAKDILRVLEESGPLTVRDLSYALDVSDLPNLKARVSRLYKSGRVVRVPEARWTITPQTNPNRDRKS